MRDFTLDKYRIYLAAISNKIVIFLRFDNYIKLIEKPEKFCLIRHEVDRKPKAALEMAKIEHEMGIVYAIGSFVPSVQWNTSKNYEIEPVDESFFKLIEKKHIFFKRDYISLDVYTCEIKNFKRNLTLYIPKKMLK